MKIYSLTKEEFLILFCPLFKVTVLIDSYRNPMLILLIFIFNSITFVRKLIHDHVHSQMTLNLLVLLIYFRSISLSIMIYHFPWSNTLGLTRIHSTSLSLLNALPFQICNCIREILIFSFILRFELFLKKKDFCILFFLLFQKQFCINGVLPLIWFLNIWGFFNLEMHSLTNGSNFFETS